MTDNDIRKALAVEPSPEFPAQVRRRIANDRPAAIGHAFKWAAPVVTAVAAIVLGVIALTWRSPAPPAALTAPTLTARRVVSAAPPLAARRSAAAARLRRQAAREARPRGNHGSVVASAETTEPEVLLAPDETRALRALIAGVRDGRIDLAPSLRSSRPAVMELEPIRELVIAPITIAPIEGVHP